MDTRGRPSWLRTLRGYQGLRSATAMPPGHRPMRADDPEQSELLRAVKQIKKIRQDRMRCWYTRHRACSNTLEETTPDAPAQTRLP